MYGADWCGDCLRSKAYLDRRGVSYAYVNLEQTPEAADIVLARNNGLKRIPVIVFGDDTHLTEPSDEALGAKLDELKGQAPIEPRFEVVNRADEGRFDLLRAGELVGFAAYHMNDNTAVVTHVETLAQHRGQGFGGKLMEGLLDILEQSDGSILPLCPFAARHLRDHPRPAIGA